MRIGYARVSTTAQNLDMQIEALNNVGCEKIYTEKESGVKERPVLQELLSFIRQGDTLVVYKLDRLGRSVRELLAMVDDLREKGISLIALQDNIDATTPGGMESGGNHEFIAWAVTFGYRAETAGGLKTMGGALYYLNKDMTEIIQRFTDDDMTDMQSEDLQDIKYEFEDELKEIFGE